MMTEIFKSFQNEQYFKKIQFSNVRRKKFNQFRRVSRFLVAVLDEVPDKRIDEIWRAETAGFRKRLIKKFFSEQSEDRQTAIILLRIAEEIIEGDGPDDIKNDLNVLVKF